MEPQCGISGKCPEEIKEKLQKFNKLNVTIPVFFSYTHMHYINARHFHCFPETMHHFFDTVPGDFPFAINIFVGN